MVRFMVTSLLLLLLFGSTSCAANVPGNFPEGLPPCPGDTPHQPPPRQDGDPGPQLHIKLSAAQQSQLSTIQSEAEQRADHLREQLDKAHQTTLKMEGANTFNESEYRKAAQQVADAEVELMVLREKTIYAIRAMLTDEQKNQLIRRHLLQLLRPNQPEEARRPNPGGAPKPLPF